MRSALSNFTHRLAYHLRVFILLVWLKPERPLSMVRYGTKYGGWWIPEILPEGDLAVCAGAGMDISFDLELAARGLRVVTVDPTPSAVEYVKRTAPEIELVDVGLWDTDGVLRLQQDTVWSESWFPEEIPTGSAGGPVVEFQVLRLKTLLERLGDTNPVIVKLDIEGAEERVVPDMLRDGITPPVLCVEFDGRTIRRTRQLVRSIVKAGYVLWQIEDWNYTFVQRERIPTNVALDTVRSDITKRVHQH